MSAINNLSSNAAIESVLAARQSASRSNVAYAVAAETLNAQRTAGDSALQLLESVANAGQAVDRGLRFDSIG